MATAAPPKPHPGTGSPVSQSGIFPHRGCLRSSAVLGRGVSRAGAFSRLGMGCMERLLWETRPPLEQTSLCPALEASLCACVPYQWSPGSYSPYISPSSPPTSQGGLSPHIGCQDWGVQSVAQTADSSGWISTCVISLFLCVPSQGNRSQPNCFSSLHT